MTDLIPVALGLALAIAAVVSVVGAQFIPTRFWFAGIALSAMPQVYSFPIVGVYPSLSLLASIGPLYSWRYFAELWRTLWFRAFVALILAHAASIAWSPFPVVGIRHIVYLLPFAVTAFVGLVGARSNFKLASRLIVAVAVLSVFQALLVVLFRVFPGIEALFWGSRLGAMVISPNVLGALYDGSPNNVFDASKAGGLFVNANTASAVLGFFAMLAWSLRSAGYGKLLRCVAAINWVAVFFTGSKAGMIAAFLVPVAAVILHRKAIHRVGLRGWTMLFFGAALVVLVAPFAVQQLLDSRFVNATANTLDVRQHIWIFAKREFFDSPLLGMGFGGWEGKFPIYAMALQINPNFPPHNAFMIAWSQSGMIAAIVLLSFMVLFLKWTFDATRSPDQRVRELGSGLFLGCTWFWIQAQGENFGILGEQHFTPLLGLLSGVLLAYIGAQKKTTIEVQTTRGGGEYSRIPDATL